MRRVDDQWHHVAVSWDWDSGAMKVLFDGKSVVPFASSDGGVTWERPAGSGGVNPILAKRRSRGATGALVLGQVRSSVWLSEKAQHATS